MILCCRWPARRFEVRHKRTYIHICDTHWTRSRERQARIESKNQHEKKPRQTKRGQFITFTTLAPDNDRGTLGNARNKEMGWSFCGNWCYDLVIFIEHIPTDPKDICHGWLNKDNNRVDCQWIENFRWANGRSLNSGFDIIIDWAGTNAESREKWHV